MAGFTQSLNLSVTVAITLFSLRHHALSADEPGDMSPEEQNYWYDRWVKRRAFGSTTGEAQSRVETNGAMNRKGRESDLWQISAESPPEGGR